MTTYLTSDWQTMMDLGIQNSSYDDRPIHLLFLDTETKEGRKMMKSWIAQPLSDLKAIEERQNAIAWNQLPSLPLNEEELDFLEYYLSYRDQLSAPNVFVSLCNTVDRLLKYDSSRYIVTRGVDLSFKLLKKLNELQAELPDTCPSLIEGLKKQIREIFVFKEMKEMLKLDESALSDFTIDRYDYLFRLEHYPSMRQLLRFFFNLVEIGLQNYELQRSIRLF